MFNAHIPQHKSMKPLKLLPPPEWFISKSAVAPARYLPPHHPWPAEAFWPQQLTQCVVRDLIWKGGGSFPQTSWRLCLPRIRMKFPRCSEFKGQKLWDEQPWILQKAQTYQLTHSMDFEIPTIWTDLIPNSLLSFSSPSGNVFWAHFTEPRLKSCREGWLKLCQRLWRYDLKQINTYCITEINKIKRFCLTDPHPPSPPMEPQSFETHHSSTILRQQWYLEKIPSIPRGWEQKKTQPGVQSQWQEFWIKAF